MKHKAISRIFAILFLLAFLISGVSCSTDSKEPASSNSETTDPAESGGDTTDSGDDNVDGSTDVDGDATNSGETASGDTGNTKNNNNNNNPSATAKPSGGSPSGSKLFSSPVTLSVTTFEHPSQPYNLKAAKFSTITEKTNVTLKFNIIPQTNYNAKLAAVLSSGVLPDIISIKPEIMVKYSTNLYYDLTDIVKTQAPNYYKWIKDDPIERRLRINGKMYGFIILNAGNYPLKTPNEDINGVFPVIRYDILDKHNLATPKTWDEWFQTMKKLKALYPNSTPYSGRSGDSILGHWSYALGAQYNLHYDYDKGEYIFGALEPQFKNILKFMADAYAEGILDPNFDKTNPNSWERGVRDGKIFFWLDNNGFADDQTLALQKTNKSAKMATMPLMTNSLGKKRGLQYPEHQYNDFQWVIGAKSSQKDKAIKFMDWCYSDEGMYVNSYGKEGENYTLKSNGSVEIPATLSAKYRNSTSPDYAWQSDLGVGFLNFAPLFSRATTMRKAIGLYKNTTSAPLKADLKAGNIKNVFVDPVLPSSVSESIAQKQSAISSSMNKEIKKIIMGQADLNTFDQLVVQWKNQGAQDVTKAYNDALKKVK